MKEEILKIIIGGNITKFNKIYDNIKNENQKKQIKDGFENHMLQITNFIQHSNFNKTKILDEDFIKNLHKIHYPEGYKKFKKTTSGDGEICIMIPGQYKTLENFPEVKPKDVKLEIEKIIDYYNSNIIVDKNKIDIISFFVLNFLKIHPFGDGNGTIAYIIFDLLLLQNGFRPVYIKKEYSHNEIYKNIKYSIINNDISFFKKSIN